MTKYYIVNITLFTLYMHMYSAAAVYKAVKKYLTILLRSCRGYSIFKTHLKVHLG